MAGSRTISIDEAGIKRLQMRFQGATQKVGAEAFDALSEIGKDLLGKSNAIVPIEDNDLRDSGFYDVREDAAGPYLVVGYDTEYALIQHENLDYRHDPGRQAKYLEQPMNENWPRYAELLKSTTMRALGG
jgi:hypothetical protein